MNQLRKHWKRKRTKSEPRKTGGRGGIVFTTVLMDKSNNWPNVLKNCRDEKRLSRRRLKLARPDPSLTQGREDLDGHDEK